MSPAEGLPPAVIVTGPTAAGKTALAMALATRWPVRLISADSAQVYRGMDIGTAKPDPATLERFPHDLIDLIEPEQAYSAARFVTDCEQAMQAAYEGGQWPVIVGGTPLYLRALLYGLDDLPEADPAFRANMAERAQEQGWAAIHAELAAIDPIMAGRVRVSDPQRIQRALEIWHCTGQPPSQLMSGPRLPRFDSVRVVVAPASRASLHARIEQRFAAMMAAGFLDEVEVLRQRPGLTIDHPAMRAVGYRQAWQWLDGQGDRAQFEAATLAATRQLAKRQLTALRQLHGGVWYDSDVVAAADGSDPMSMRLAQRMARLFDDCSVDEAARQ